LAGRRWALGHRLDSLFQPVFFIRDPVKFPSVNRSHKRHPGTNTSNADMFWDFHINNQESIHALMFLFGDRGLPSSVRHVNAYSGNTYKFTKSDGSYHYVRIHLTSNQGIHYFTNTEGAELAGTQPDRHLVDLQSAIESGDFPSWNVYVQVIHPNDISGAPFDIFDMTKVWPHGPYPLRKAGRMVLNRNPTNWFAEIEQAAFSPSTMVPGIEPSPDPMLQARMFAYPDAARYRLGVNYQFLPTNAPRSEVYCPIERDGLMNFTKNYGQDPNYIGTKLKPVKFYDSDRSERMGKQDVSTANTSQKTEINPVTALDHAHITAPVSFASTVSDKDFEQATALWHVMAKQDGAQLRLVNNVAAHVSGVKEKWIREEVYGTIFL
jgi:catalase